MGKLKVGVLGWGFIGPVHAAAANGNNDIAEVVAVAESNKTKHKQIQEAGYKPVEKAEEVIADKDIDVIHIAGPDKYHKPWAMQAMDAGKKIIVCEKPLTETLADSTELTDRVLKFEEDTGGVFMTHFNYLGHPAPRAIRELRQKGYFGKNAYMFDGRYLQEWLMVNEQMTVEQKVAKAIADVYNWRLESPTDSCARKDIKPHLLAAAVFMMGSYPVEVYAQSVNFIPKRAKGPDQDAFDKEPEPPKPEDMEIRECDSDLYTAVICKFANGAVGNFVVTQALAGHKNDSTYTFGGSKRSATWIQEDPNSLYIGQNHNLNVDLNDPKAILDPGQVGNIKIINDPGALAAMGCTDAAKYSIYPGGHPMGHGNAIEEQIGTAYRIGTGLLPREKGVIPGVLLGHMAVAVGEAVIESAETGRLVKVDYKGFDKLLAQGRI